MTISTLLTKHLRLRNAPVFYCFLWGLKIVLLIYFAITACIVLKSRVDTLSVVNADTEILRFSVNSTSYERIPLDSANIQIGADPDGKDIRGCVSGFFVPEKGATVLLVRQTSNYLTVNISPPIGSNRAGTLSQQKRSAEGNDELEDTPVSGIVQFVLSADSTCETTARNIRIPISGLVTLGNEYGPHSDYNKARPTLLSGEVKMFGRASPLFPFNLIGFGQSLYSAGTFSLPAGARLRECNGKTSWWGFADVRLENDDKMASLKTNLTTDVGTFALITSGGQNINSQTGTEQCPDSDNTRGSNEDLVKIGLLSRMSGDPYILLVCASASFLYLVLQTAAAIYAISPRHNLDVGKKNRE